MADKSNTFFRLNKPLKVTFSKGKHGIGSSKRMGRKGMENNKNKSCKAFFFATADVICHPKIGFDPNHNGIGILRLKFRPLLLDKSSGAHGQFFETKIPDTYI